MLESTRTRNTECMKPDNQLLNIVTVLGMATEYWWYSRVHSLRFKNEGCCFGAQTASPSPSLRPSILLERERAQGGGTRAPRIGTSWGFEQVSLSPPWFLIHYHLLTGGHRTHFFYHPQRSFNHRRMMLAVGLHWLSGIASSWQH